MIETADRLAAIHRLRDLETPAALSTRPTSAFGQHVRVPVAVATMAVHGRAHPDAEVATARAVEIARSERVVALALLGTPRVGDVTRSHLAAADPIA